MTHGGAAFGESPVRIFLFYLKLPLAVQHGLSVFREFAVIKSDEEIRTVAEDVPRLGSDEIPDAQKGFAV